MNTSYANHFQKMPENILVTIFTLAVAESPTIFPLQVFNNILYVLLFVCKRWSIAVLRTPSIWVSAIFEHEAASTGPQMTAKSIKQFSVFLRRSRRELLNVTFSTTSVGWGLSDVNTVLTLCHSRVQSLTCMLSSAGEMDAFLSQPPGQFQELRNVNISFSGDGGDSTYTSTQNGSSNAFKRSFFLNTAILHRIPNRLNHVKLGLLWAKLEHIDFGGTAMLPHTFIKILRYTSFTLQSAFIFVKFEGPRDITLMESHTVLMPNLTALRLRLQYPNRNWSVLSLFHVPALIKFRLEIFNVIQHWSIMHIAQFLKPSWASLQQLHLGDFKPSGHLLKRTQQQTSHTALSDLFNLTPKIKTLRLPLSIPVHATTIENIASGEILKSLSIMELSYPNVCHGLDLVRRRGTLARMTATGQGCSAAEEPAVSALDSLSLWIPRHLCNMEDVFDINTKRKILVSEGLIDHIHIRPTSELPLPISRRV